MNILAKRSFPEFYQSYAPKLLEFYSAWLDWTDLKGNSQYIINHLSTEQDIDESIEAYRTHLKDKYLNKFPEQMVIDLKLLLKNVLYLYRAKSSKKAYDFLFRVLFDSPAKLWYPRENILKTSDGRWYIPCYISFEPVVNSDGESLFPQYDDEILTDAFGNTIDNAYILENCHYYRITGDISKSISYIEQPTNFAGTVKTRDENGDVILKDLDELTEGGYQYGQSAISITSSTGWFYPGESVTITNVDTGEELPYHPVVQWYVETAGHYTSNKGFLSDINCLQDNYFYQNYSYVIQSYVGIRYWRDIVKKLLHPAGLGFFAEVLLSGDLEDGDGIYYYKDIDDRPKDTFGDNEDMQQYLEEHPEYADSFNPKDQCETYIDYVRKFYMFFRHILEYSNNILDYCFDAQGNYIYVEDSEEYLSKHPGSIYYEFSLIDDNGRDISYIINEDFTSVISPKNIPIYDKFTIYKDKKYFTYILEYDENNNILNIINDKTGKKTEVTDNAFDFTLNLVTTKYTISEDRKTVTDGTNTFQILKAFTIVVKNNDDEEIERTVYSISEDYTKVLFRTKTGVNSFVTIKESMPNETKNKERCCYKVYDEKDKNGNIIKVCYKPSYSYSINILDYVYDENGNLLDENGNPMQYDENGNPIGKPKTQLNNWRNLKTNKLAQTRSIITDIWLFEDNLSKLYPDLKLTDLIPYKNRNSVLLFRDLGTLIDTEIIDWAYVGFIDDIDIPFDYNGVRITKYKTSSIYGVTLRPQYDVISGEECVISSNEFVVNTEKYNFIPDNYLVFVSSQSENNTSRVGTLTIKNDYLNYYYSDKKDDIENDSFRLGNKTYIIQYDTNNNPVNIFSDVPDITLPIDLDTNTFNDNNVIYTVFFENGIPTRIIDTNEEVVATIQNNVFSINTIIDGAIINTTNYELSFDDNKLSSIIKITPDIYIPLIKNRFKIGTVNYEIDFENNKVSEITFHNLNSYNKYADKLIKDTILDDCARMYDKLGNYTDNNDNDNNVRTTITRWGTLVTDDFIFTSADSNRVFNQYSLVKIPDDYVTIDEENSKYIFNKNAYIDEKIRVYNYSDNDFSYKIWIERNNYDITVKITFFGNAIPNRFKNASNTNNNPPENEYWKLFIKNQSLECNRYYKTLENNKLVLEYKLKTPSNLQISQFEVEFPEYIDDNRFMLFINGLFTPKHNVYDDKKTKIIIDTVENENITYETEDILLADLSLESLVSISETNTELFGEFTLPDIAMLEKSMEQIRNIDLLTLLRHITSSEISTQTSYAELYVLSQIEAPTPRILRYPYYPNYDENRNLIKETFVSRAYAEDYGKDVEDIEDINNPELFKEKELYFFTYDNLRLMPFVPHSINIKKHAVAEIAPDKERLKPKSYNHISWNSIFNKEIKLTYHSVIKKTNPAQNHSELLDMVLDRFNYDEYNIFNTGTVQEFTNNYDILATTNRSSTLVFDENGNKVDSNNIDWARKFIDNIPGRTLYSVPLNSTKVMETYSIPYKKNTENYVLQSNANVFKPSNAFIFVNGIKVLDADIKYNKSLYRYTINKKYFTECNNIIEIYNINIENLLTFNKTGNNKTFGYISFENSNGDNTPDLVCINPRLVVTVEEYIG